MNKRKMIFHVPAKGFSGPAKTIFIILLFSVILLACKKDEKPDVVDKDTSYAFGMFIAGQIGMPDMYLDPKAFTDGFRDVSEGREPRLTEEEAMDKIRALFMELQAREEEKMWLEGDKNREEGEAYMAANGAQSGVFTTPSGLQYSVITQGSGAKPGPEDWVSVNYEGTFLDGTVFDSSYRNGGPAEFSLDMVIAGWTEGLQLMNEGSRYRFVVPSDLAYGPTGAGPIPPGSTLIFTVELISILDR